MIDITELSPAQLLSIASDGMTDASQTNRAIEEAIDAFERGMTDAFLESGLEAEAFAGFLYLAHGHGAATFFASLIADGAIA